MYSHTSRRMTSHTTQALSPLVGQTLSVNTDEDICRTPSPSRSTTLLQSVVSTIEHTQLAQSLIFSLKKVIIGNGCWAASEGGAARIVEHGESVSAEAKAGSPIAGKGRLE